jgi:hypothetical protein
MSSKAAKDRGVNLVYSLTMHHQPPSLITSFLTILAAAQQIAFFAIFATRRSILWSKHHHVAPFLPSVSPIRFCPCFLLETGNFTDNKTGRRRRQPDKRSRNRGRQPLSALGAPPPTPARMSQNRGVTMRTFRTLVTYPPSSNDIESHRNVRKVIKMSVLQTQHLQHFHQFQPLRESIIA